MLYSLQKSLNHSIKLFDVDHIGTPQKSLGHPQRRHHHPSLTCTDQRLKAFSFPQGLVSLSLGSISISSSPSDNSSITSLLSSISVQQLAVATICAYVAAAWPNRPRGWSRTDLVEVKKSPTQGKGLFARHDIPENTVIGAYPGRLRNATAMAAKCHKAPLAQHYCFKNKNGYYLDPTDWSGLPSRSPAPGLPWPFVDVSLSFANEPPKSSPGVNLSVEDDPNDENGLVFVSIIPIPAGTELFIDYGLDYDRSSYGVDKQHNDGLEQP